MGRRSGPILGRDCGTEAGWELAEEGGVFGEIEEKDLVDCFEVGVVFELPNHFFIGGDLEELGLFADVSVAEIITKNGISVGESLATGDEA